MTFGTATSPAKLYIEAGGVVRDDHSHRSHHVGLGGHDLRRQLRLLHGFTQKVAPHPLRPRLASGPHAVHDDLPVPRPGVQLQRWTGRRKEPTWRARTAPSPPPALPRDLLDTEGGGKADGSTPIANSLIDIKSIWSAHSVGARPLSPQRPQRPLGHRAGRVRQRRAPPAVSARSHRQPRESQGKDHRPVRDGR